MRVDKNPVRCDTRPLNNDAARSRVDKVSAHSITRDMVVSDNADRDAAKEQINATSPNPVIPNLQPELYVSPSVRFGTQE